MPRVVTLRGKFGIVRNEIECEPLEDNLFLEFGKRVGEDYRYIALMKGDINYTSSKGARQLYFTHFAGGKWRVLDDTCLELVEDYATKEEAIARLRELAEQHKTGAK